MTNTPKFLPYFQGLTYLVLFSLLSLMLAACGDVTPVVTSVTPKPSASANVNATSPTASSVPTPTLSQVFPKLVNLPALATSMTIQNDYDALTYGYKAHYTLNRQTAGFIGTGEFSATNGAMAMGAKNPNAPSFPYDTSLVLTRTITIPVNVVQGFLQDLTQLPVEEGHYDPFLSHTDDYPVENYQITTPEGVLNLKCTAQNNVPWGIDFAGREFVVNSPLAYQATIKVTRYLQLKTTGEVINKAKRPVTPTTAVTSPAAKTPNNTTSGTTLSQTEPPTIEAMPTASGTTP